jgi:hypothetical protein
MAWMIRTAVRGRTNDRKNQPDKLNQKGVIMFQVKNVWAVFKNDDGNLECDGQELIVCVDYGRGPEIRIMDSGGQFFEEPSDISNFVGFIFSKSKPDQYELADFRLKHFTVRLTQPRPAPDQPS